VGGVCGVLQPQWANVGRAVDFANEVFPWCQTPGQSPVYLLDGPACISVRYMEYVDDDMSS